MSFFGQQNSFDMSNQWKKKSFISYSKQKFLFFDLDGIQLLSS